jgi:enoyl-CoA hydratase/carnithine racemase
MTETILAAHQDGICRITIHRAERKNALTQTMYAATIAALEAADQSRDVRAILLTATGDVFCSGNDLADFAQNAASYPPGVTSPAAQFPYALNLVKKPLGGVPSSAPAITTYTRPA